MPSLGWIDFSSEHRDKVRTVIDFLNTPGVVDELGIGVIRDSFSGYFFPGISTIQTRAKYFTILALLIRNYEEESERKKRRQTLEQYLEEWEKWVRIQLAERYGDEGEALGIIGISFGKRTDRDVQRKPSSIYWNGMRKFGIIRTNLSLSEYSRRYSGSHMTLKTIIEETEREKGDDADADDTVSSRVWVPETDQDYWDNLAITLTKQEAEFLRHQITAHVPDSLLGQILLDENALEQFLELDKAASFGDL